MKKKLQSDWILAAVLAALPAVMAPMSALGQAQINANGHARDSNPQIGSGGLNGSSGIGNPNNAAYGQTGLGLINSGNNVVYGTVSNGRALQINDPIQAPGAFQGNKPLAGASIANFQRDSIGVPTAYAPPTPINTSTPFIPQSLGIAPPPGFVQTPNTSANGFVPSTALTPPPLNDQRLGQSPGVPVNLIPGVGQLMLPGQVDPTTNAQSVQVASPLFGVKTLGSDANDQSFLQRYGQQGQDNALDRLQLDPRTVDRMRNELRGLHDEGAVNSQQGGPLDARLNGAIGSGGGPGTTPAPGQLTGSLGSQTLSAQPLQSSLAPSSAQLSSQPLTGAIGATPGQNQTGTGQIGAGQTGAANNLSTGQSVTNVKLDDAARQSGQYGKMRDQLATFYKDRAKAQETAVKLYNEQVKAQQKGPAGGPPVPTGPAAPAAGTPMGPSGPLLSHDLTKQADAIAHQSGVAHPVPVMVSSLTTDVSAKGMHEVLARAEALMKAGKFTTAIDEYNAAEQIATGQPIVPLVWVGRGNAELGAGYYSRAENQLKRAFTIDPALLMAKYDLRTFIGEKRLEAVVNDLKELASTNPKSPTPLFLLAYISYNTGSERRAAAFLDLAEKRGGANDPVYKLLRDHWTLDVPDATKSNAPANK